MDRYLVISSDGHAGPRPQVYREYLEPQVPRGVRRPARGADGGARAGEPDARDAAGEPEVGGGQPARAGRRRGTATAATRCSTPTAVAAEVLFVDGLTEENSPPFGGDLGLVPLGAVPELQWAGARAHNRWIAEFVAMAPERRFGLAQVTPFWGVDVRSKEIRSRASSGLRGIMLPHMWPGQDPYHHPKYEPLVGGPCADLGMVHPLPLGRARRRTDYFGAGLFGAQPRTGHQPSRRSRCPVRSAFT
jgi:hypothetical protein